MERIEQFDGELHAYLTINHKIGEEARRLTLELKKGKTRSLLHGIPVSVKDLIDTTGIRTTYGSRFYGRNIPRRDAAVVKSLKANGALILGKTNCDEFGLGIESPPTRNPWDKTRMAGGSSGGSAAALGADLAIASLGTDTGGSIRIPSSFCGVTGLKPTYGKLSMAGIFPASKTLDHVGPMCRFASDLPLLLKAMGYAPLRPRRQTSPVVLALVKEFADQAPVRIRRAIDRCLDKIVSENIAQVTEIKLSILDALFQASETIDFAEVAWVHKRLFSSRPSLYRPSSRQLIEEGLKVTRTDYLAAQAVRRKIAKSLVTLAKEYHVLVTPAVLSQVPTARSTISAKEYYSLIAPSEVFNALGWPSLVAPVGFSNKMPIGVQFVGSPEKDELVVRLASEYQETTEWHTLTPARYHEIDIE
jgi:Asp-tRNA(Asn)/Glu-tRNA(Gln) amidotransferase A subunit family amidase